MSVVVRTTAYLDHFTKDKREVELLAESVGDCLNNLETQFPGIRETICDEQGELRGFINIYVNGEDVRLLQGLATPLHSGDEVSIVPALAGG